MNFSLLWNKKKKRRSGMVLSSNEFKDHKAVFLER